MVLQLGAHVFLLGVSQAPAGKDTNLLVMCKDPVVISLRNI